MIRGELCDIYEAHILNIGNDVVCLNYCPYRWGDKQPCGEKGKCKLFDASKIPEMELR